MITFQHLHDFVHGEDATEDSYFELLIDFRTHGFSDDVPLPLRTATTRYFDAHPGDSAAYWFDKMQTLVGEPQ